MRTKTEIGMQGPLLICENCGEVVGSWLFGQPNEAAYNEASWHVCDIYPEAPMEEINETSNLNQ